MTALLTIKEDIRVPEGKTLFPIRYAVKKETNETGFVIFHIF